jgi:hypothetical protein
MINEEMVRLVDARPEMQLPRPKSQSKNLQSVEITKVRASANKDPEYPRKSLPVRICREWPGKSECKRVEMKKLRKLILTKSMRDEEERRS